MKIEHDTPEAIAITDKVALELMEVEKLKAINSELLEALRDMLSGWKYIRQTHGDLYGVGWDRAQSKAEMAIAKATGEQA